MSLIELIKQQPERSDAPLLSIADLEALFNSVPVENPTHIVMSERTHRLIRAIFRHESNKKQLRKRFSHLTNKQFRRILTGKIVP
mgnify:CR=1 FL=1